MNRWALLVAVTALVAAGSVAAGSVATGLVAAGSVAAGSGQPVFGRLLLLEAWLSCRFSWRVGPCSAAGSGGSFDVGCIVAVSGGFWRSGVPSSSD